MESDRLNNTKNNIQNVVLVIDMQEGMWAREPVEEDLSVPEDMRPTLNKIMEGKAVKRKETMAVLAQDMQDFTREMRAQGAQIVWVLSDKSLDARWGGVHASITPDKDSDIFLTKNGKFVSNENKTFLERLKTQAESSGKTLQLKVCGVWSNAGICTTILDLFKAGYDVHVIGDMILDGTKPCLDVVRPGPYETYALQYLGTETGRGDQINETSQELLRKQKHN